MSCYWGSRLDRRLLPPPFTGDPTSPPPPHNPPSLAPSSSSDLSLSYPFFLTERTTYLTTC